jgi:hypothetical protein
LDKNISNIFNDIEVIVKIKERLPYLFQLAEMECSRAGKVGMGVGSLREKIILALLIYLFGEENVKTDIPITASEIDVEVFDNPISIKTITGRNITGIKLIWTVDSESAQKFKNSYNPDYDLILINIVWNESGYFYYIPSEVQREVFDEIGRENYIKLPKNGTNPRGVEMSKDAIDKIINHQSIKKILINWNRTKIDYHPYERWIEYWKD